jgi:ribosome modulation factor
MPIGTQGSLFAPQDGAEDQLPDAVTQSRVLFDAQQSGYDAALQDAPSDGCPFQAGTDVAENWMRGHASGREFMRGLGDGAGVPVEAQPRQRRGNGARQPEDYLSA